MSSIPTMTSDTCLAIATMMPIFLVGLIAEKLIFKPSSKSRRDRALQLVQVFLRAAVDFCTAVLIVGAIIVALIGTDEGGLRGRDSVTEWTLTIFVIVIVLTRWVALSPGFRYPLEALFDLLFAAIFVGIARIVLARAARRMRSQWETLGVGAPLDLDDIGDRAVVVSLLTESLFRQLKDLVNMKWLPKSKETSISEPPEQLVLLRDSDFAERLVTFWSVIPGVLGRVSDPAQRSLFAARDHSSFAKLIRIWAMEPTSLTQELIEENTRHRLYKSFLQATHAHAIEAENG